MQQFSFLMYCYVVTLGHHSTKFYYIKNKNSQKWKCLSTKKLFFDSKSQVEFWAWLFKFCAFLGQSSGGLMKMDEWNRETILMTNLHTIVYGTSPWETSSRVSRCYHYCPIHRVMMSVLFSTFWTIRVLIVRNLTVGAVLF